MNEIEKELQEGAARDMSQEILKPMVYVLEVNINEKKYYVTDLNGNLSRNVMDSMLFWDEASAASYAGPVESLIEERANRIATIKALRVPLSGVIPKTPFECIPCP